MKYAIISLLMISSLFMLPCFGQSREEAAIRKLEEAERMAIWKQDTSQLALLLSKKIVVQNPENKIVGYRQIMDRMKADKINYASFERKIDNIAFVNGMAVVMGQETLVPQGDNPNKGKTVKRRFTNVWTKEAGQWKLTARQATIVSVE